MPAHDENVLESGTPTGSDSSYTRWVVGVVGAAVIASLAWFATNDRASVEQRLEMYQAFASTTSGTLAVHEYRLDEQRDRLVRIESKLDEILDRLPAQSRGKAK